MKIGINALFFKYPATGSGQYMSHLIKALSEVDHENEYVLFGPDSLTDDMQQEMAFPYQALSMPGFARNNDNVEKLLWEQLTGPSAARKDIINTLKLPPERIHVIYEAAGDEYRPITDPARLAAARARYGVGERYIFYLGGMD